MARADDTPHPTMEFRWLKWKDGGRTYGYTLQQKWNTKSGQDVWRCVPNVAGEKPADLPGFQK